MARGYYIYSRRGDMGTFDCMIDIATPNSRRRQPPLALAVPLSRFTSFGPAWLSSVRCLREPTA
jgi:hypothetical protein